MNAVATNELLSLTLVNWNGFFARTFELDPTVTTLSGGNGAGKSTILAALLTLLVPDLSLLHFRNTTEAGSTGASRDKGLYGKLGPGVSYSLLRFRQGPQEALAGVRLLPLSSREGKVELKPFLVPAWPQDLHPIEAFTTPLPGGSRVRVSELKEVKTRLEKNGVELKLPGSLIDYHQQLFQLGVLPKNFRSQTERAKLYRLFEASLYGGISNALSRSLKGYLLTEQPGLKRAFQELESALQENQLTRLALKNTEASRDLFRTLLSSAVEYVAADCYRHQRKLQRQNTEVQSLRKSLEHVHHQLVVLLQIQNTTHAERRALQEALLKAQEQVERCAQGKAQVQVCLRQQARIDDATKQAETACLQLSQAQSKGAELQKKLRDLSSALEATGIEIQQIQAERADQQTALKGEQWRRVQRQQAQETLEKARPYLGHTGSDRTPTSQEVLSELERVQHKLDELQARQWPLLKAQSQAKTEALQRQAAWELLSELAQALELPLTEDPDENADLNPCRERLLGQAVELERLAQETPLLQGELQSLEQKRNFQQQAQARLQMWHQVRARFPLPPLQWRAGEAEAAIQTELYRLKGEASHALQALQEVQGPLRETEQQLWEAEANQKRWAARLPAWSHAIQTKQAIETELECPFPDLESVVACLKALRKALEDKQAERQRLMQQLEGLKQEIQGLALQNLAKGGSDPILSTWATQVGGKLLSECVDSVPLSDAPFLSALLSPYAEAIVVADPQSAKEKLHVQVEAAGKALYLLPEGPFSTDALHAFPVENGARGVWVWESADRLRYSPFPSRAWAGSAARAVHLEVLKRQAEDEEAHKLTHDRSMAELKRKVERLETFLATQATEAFGEDADVAQAEGRKRLADLRQKDQQQKTQRAQIKRQLDAAKSQEEGLRALLPYAAYLQGDSGDQGAFEALDSEFKALQARLAKAKAGQKRWVAGAPLYRKALQLDLRNLSPAAGQGNWDVQLKQLQSEQQTHLEQKLALENLSQQINALDYAEVSIESGAEALLQRLQERLQSLQARRLQQSQEVEGARAAAAAQHEKSLQWQAKLESLRLHRQSLEAELSGLQASLPPHAFSVSGTLKPLEYFQPRLEQAQRARDCLQAQLAAAERDAATAAAHQDENQRKLENLRAQYRLARAQRLQTGAERRAIQRRAKASGLEGLLFRPKMEALDEWGLRQRSDRALGQLRALPLPQEGLRARLNATEGLNPSCLKKLDFLKAALEYLRERIRQDLFLTSDPIQAIEAMESELQRLGHELEGRERKLTVSRQGAARLIQQAVQREQLRIEQLNAQLQGAQFGEVQAVRLRLDLLPTHARLLETLLAPTPPAGWERATQSNAPADNPQIRQGQGFFETLGELYCQWVPEARLSESGYPVRKIGEDLLDYRNYLRLTVEVHKRNQGWVQAESGLLSTGEAIGTGMITLMMVVRSWEEEAARYRGVQRTSCRFLLLDEAARLDANSIGTLYELCRRLRLQLLLAAPEEVGPAEGTTYQLKRHIGPDGQPHVHVIGLRHQPKESKA